MGDAATTLSEASQRCRLNQKQANDVRWFFSDAEGELGLRGVNLESSHAGSFDGDDTRAAVARERWSRVNRIFEEIGQASTWSLRRFYEPMVWRGLEAFGAFSGLALRSDAAKREFRKDTGSERAGTVAFEKWLRDVSEHKRTSKGEVLAKATALVGVIIADCDRALMAACRLYDRHEMLLVIRGRKERTAKLRMVSNWTRDAPDDD